MISEHHFDYLRTWLKKETGLVYEKDKMYLIEHRLKPLALRHEYHDVNAFIQALYSTEFLASQRTDIINALVTNETYFYRDVQLFKELTQWIVEHTQRHSAKSFSIWSNGCSTGQEPYSLAMMLEEMKNKLHPIQYQIWATDISTRALADAQAGVYNHFEAQRGLSMPQLLKWFEQIEDKGLTFSWKIDERLKRQIAFESYNLLKPKQMHQQFDIILLRNVLIYFDLNQRREIIGQMLEALRPDGVIILGGSETMLPFSHQIKKISGFQYLYASKMESSPIPKEETAKTPFVRMSDEDVQSMLRNMVWPKL